MSVLRPVFFKMDIVHQIFKNSCREIIFIRIFNVLQAGIVAFILEKAEEPAFSICAVFWKKDDVFLVFCLENVDYQAFQLLIVIGSDRHGVLFRVEGGAGAAAGIAVAAAAAVAGYGFFFYQGHVIICPPG